MSEAVLNVSDLHKSYQQGGNSLRVLRGLNLEVMRGERVAIIGLSGSGKLHFYICLEVLIHRIRGPCWSMAGISMILMKRQCAG